MDRQIVSLLCRTADRGPEAADGTRELAELLQARVIGSPGEPRAWGWEEDLRASRGCLLEAGGQLDDAFVAGRVPVILAGDCSICIATLPVVARHHPDAHVLWIDAHGDFHTPDTTTSGYLGGMCLAGACGLWETGFGAGPEPARIVMYGVRDIDGGERVNLDTSGVHRIDDAAPLAGLEVFVHIDLDVIDPDELPAAFPSADGLTARMLRGFLAEVMMRCDVVGAEITSAAPGYGEVAADAIAPLLADPV
ncbi:MAG: arginase [Solirubrobacteraceae bacterium]|jgi:arginase family enzyme|nr:arginase [Solirubrobacteraceae bacterium]